MLDLEAFWAKHLPIYYLISVSHRQFPVSQGVRRIKIKIHNNIKNKKIILIVFLSEYLKVAPFFVSSVVEWLKRRARDQHGLCSKPTRAILLCPWERHFTAH